MQADQQIGNHVGVTAVTSGTTPVNSGASYSDADVLTVSAMRTRLAAIDGTLYTSDYLDMMSYNDMVYAIRLNDNSNTFQQ